MSNLRNLVLVGLAALSGTLSAQDPKRRLEFTVSGVAKDTVYLANYYGNKLYYNDTAVADAKGRCVFQRAKGYKAGVYAVVVPGPRYFEILVNEPEVVMETDTADLLSHLKVKKSVENQVFLDYVRFLGEKKKEGESLQQRMEATKDPIAKGTFKQQLTDLDKAVKQYMNDAVAKNTGAYAATLIRMSIEPEHVEIKRPDGTVDSSATYYHYRQHYWDNTDLTDERILRAPVFQNKFDEYIGKVVPQVPDTINKLADDLVARMSSTPELWKFAVHNITYKYETSEIMGMDAVFVHMAQTYYCPKGGEASKATWMSKEKLDKLCERARKQAPLVIGAKSREIILTDTTEQRWISMHRMPSEYVLVVFWDPHCGHCKKALPDMYKQYQEKLKPIGVEVYAVAKATDSTLFADWKAFIRENDLQWTNVGLTWHVYQEARKNSSKYIPQHTTIESLNYSETWDVYTTPRFFLIDADRKIVGKQIDPDQVVKLVTQLRKTKAKTGQ
ncbi:MAG: DUF5106 domain-containing protein [Flavobacteriales bacterium]|nr:DUF5106 domain-containing protein [Flavobacteriales bacterium]